MVHGRPTSQAFQNSASATAGAVIAGGGTSASANGVTGNYGVVGGGHGNVAGNFGVINGGAYNQALPQRAIISGGFSNHGMP